MVTQGSAKPLCTGSIPVCASNIDLPSQIHIKYTQMAGKSTRRRGLRGIIIFVLLLTVGIAVTVYLLSQQQDLRQRASDDFRSVSKTGDISGEGSCDVNDDNTIDLVDYSTIVECVQEGDRCTTEARQNADLNSDGQIDSLDLNLFHRTCQISQSESSTNN